MELKPLNREPNAIVYSKQIYTALEKDMIYHLVNQLPDWKTGSTWDSQKLFSVKFHKSELTEKKHTRIVTALKNLNEKKIIKINDKKKNAEFTSIFPDCKIENGYITIQLLGKYVPDFTDLRQGYSVYSIADIFALNGINAKRLFEMFSGYVNRDDSVYKIDIQLLRQYLSLENKYKTSNSNFKKYVIDPAIEQINEKTSLSVDCELKREGKITYLIFPIERKEKEKDSNTAEIKLDKPKYDADYNEQQVLAGKRAKSMEFTDKQIEEIMRIDRYEFFNKWYANFQADIVCDWGIEIARGKYYNAIKSN